MALHRRQALGGAVHGLRADDVVGRLDRHRGAERDLVAPGLDLRLLVGGHARRGVVPVVPLRAELVAARLGRLEPRADLLDLVHGERVLHGARARAAAAAGDSFGVI